MNPYLSTAVRPVFLLEILLKTLTQLLLPTGAVSVVLALVMFLAPPMSMTSPAHLLHWGLWSMAFSVGSLLTQGILFHRRFYSVPATFLMIVCMTLLFVCLKLAYPLLQLVMQHDLSPLGI